MSRAPSHREAGTPLVRWIGSATAVLLVHGVAAWLALSSSAPPAAGSPMQAVMIELTPLPVASPAPSTESPPDPQVAETPSEPVPGSPDPIEPSPPEEAEPPSVETARAEPPDAPAVEMREVPNPPAILPPPARPESRADEKRNEARPRQAKERPKREPHKQPARAAAAPPPSAPARIAAAPAADAAAHSSAAPATWRVLLVARLNRAKRYPPAAQARREQGVARLSFTIDRAGRVMSYRVVGSSGSALLDAEVIAMVQRASPLPAPPPEVPGAQISLVVPIRFDLN